MSVDFEAIRKQEWPVLEQMVFLDAACVSFAPQRTVRAVKAFADMTATQEEENSSAHHIAMDSLRGKAYDEAAKLLNADPEEIALDVLGPALERHPVFPDRTNVEFVAVEGDQLRLRVWERGSGETLACGTGACAAVVAAVANGFCSKGSDVTVRVKGGDLVVHYTDETVTLTGDAKLVYTGEAEY